MGNGRVKEWPFTGIERRSIAHNDRAGRAGCHTAQADDRVFARKSSLRPRQIFFSTAKKTDSRA
jgi:hypothetical protein